MALTPEERRQQRMRRKYADDIEKLAIAMDGSAKRIREQVTKVGYLSDPNVDMREDDIIRSCTTLLRQVMEHRTSRLALRAVCETLTTLS